ncbi:MAG: PD-(D/E)XK nuclease family protein [Acetatifactor sp.]
MSLRFVFGPSGSGKSRLLYEEMIARAEKNPGQNFLIIVPDQFTMQTQKELVQLSDRGGIMNIDVLSFGRLCHRILEEVGGGEIPVLDDTGKSLVLQKVAAGMKDRLPMLGSFLHRQGYIHEVKSALSEFMQYGIAPEDLPALIEFAGKRGALSQKLMELETLYKGFRDYIQGNFITTEEKLDVLRRSLAKSAILPGSVVVFDGFTGFTPIQYRVIQEMMRLCQEVVVVLTMGMGENPYQPDGEQRLFHLSKKTVADLCGLAEAVQVTRERDCFVCFAGGEKGAGSGDMKKGVLPQNGELDCEVVANVNHRFRKAPALQFLEQHLFQHDAAQWQQEQQEIYLFETGTTREEVHQTGLKIKELVQKEGLVYRDIAVVSGDLEGYAPYVETEFLQMEIPCYIDRTRGIVLNPMIEFIKSALELYLRDFSYEAVFHYLRSGLADMTPEEVDLLDNYCLQTGIRHKKAYSNRFTRNIWKDEEGEARLEKVNALRERFMTQVEMLSMGPSDSVESYVNKLYDFLVQNQVQQKLTAWEQEFTQTGQTARAGEYAQIYRLVMELLEQIYGLLREETITLQEFSDILEAGFGEIEVGTIPQNVDRVLVGDIERTRLKQVRVLFFLGVNDGNIPRNASKGGIISDMDREFLRESGKELAPSPRQQMFIQRLYLYLNMTKPSERLYISYAKMNSAGKSIRPAYLIETIKRMFPALKTEHPELRSALEQVVTGQEGAGYLAEGLREYVAGAVDDKREKEIIALYSAYGQDDLKITRDILYDAAFKKYEESGLSAVVARALYGTVLENSVSRLETYAACAYRHFLQYGLSLRERKEFAFESVDLGNVYHEVLENFAGKISEGGYTWFDFPEAFAGETVQKALEECAASYGNTVLYSSSRNEYAIRRMGRILTRTVLTIQRQLKKGSFHPDAYELSFRSAASLDDIHLSLTGEERMRLRGRIDRVDIAEDEEHVLVKVVDYKSGDKHFDLAALYYGLQLQLVVYMNAALEYEKKKHPEKEVLPAALLYYHVDDPAVESPVELGEEELRELIEKQLKMKGVVSSEPGIVERLDGEMENKSDVIPVERNKDGSFSAKSSVMSGEELQIISDYVSRKITDIGKEILDGTISLNPYEKGSEEACTWCAFQKVCGFETAIPGCKKRKLEDLPPEEIMRRMREGKE